MEALTHAIARFASEFRADSPPPAALTLAREAFLDLVGVMIAGSVEPVADVLRRCTGHDTGPCAALLDPALRRSASAAALINGTCAHALDFDDVQFNGHPSTVLVPAILAEAERAPVSGTRALAAYVLGYEVWGELHGRERDPYHDRGWHPTSVLGTLAAAASVAWLRGLDADAARRALSLSASFTGGVVGNFGSMAKPLHAGRAAAAAVQAADYAQAGMTAGLDAIGAKDGILAALSPRGRVDRDAPIRLGERWFSVDKPLIYKKYPVCFSSHRPVDALLEMVRTHGLRAQEVASIDVRVRGTQARVLRFDRPRTALEAKFSIQFPVACALLRGRVSLADLEDGFVQSAPVQALFERIHFTALPAAEEGQPTTADRAIVTRVDGRVLDSGPLEQAAPHTRLAEKFLDCCRAGGLADGHALFAALDALPTLDDLRTLVTLADQGRGGEAPAEARLAA